MVGWHHQLNEYEFEQTLGDSEGQGNLACCSPWVIFVHLTKSQMQLNYSTKGIKSIDKITSQNFRNFYIVLKHLQRKWCICAWFLLKSKGLDTIENSFW